MPTTVDAEAGHLEGLANRVWVYLAEGFKPSGARYPLTVGWVEEALTRHPEPT